MAVARLRKENQVDNTLLGDQDSGLSVNTFTPIGHYRSFSIFLL